MSNACRSLCGTRVARSMRAGAGRGSPPGGQPRQFEAGTRERCGRVECLLLRRHQERTHAGLGAVHAGTAHRLQRRLLAGDHLDHPVRAEVHRGVALDHDDDVTEGGDVGTAGGTRPNRAHMRDGPAGADLVPEDPPAPRRPGKRSIWSVMRPGGVDEVDHRHAGAVGGLDDADDLLDGPRTPGAGLDGRIVRHHADRPAVDGGGAGDDAVGGKVTGDHVREDAVLDE